MKKAPAQPKGQATSFSIRPAGIPDPTVKFGPDFQQKLQGLESGVSLEEQEIIAALPQGSALLIVRKGPNAGARFLLDQDSTVAGRHPEADIFLDDVTVSRRHAEFVRHHTSFEVKDMGSLNGTYFDGVLVDQALLLDGAEVQVGKFPGRQHFRTCPPSWRCIGTMSAILS